LSSKKIIWLASYPKSGNTWFRAFLTNLFLDDDKTFDINELQGGPIASDRNMFDEHTNLDSSELCYDEVDNLRPDVYREFASTLDEVRFMKVHDAYTYLNDGRAMFPHDVSLGCVYIVRNPFDLGLSFANHLNASVEKTVEYMNNPEFAFASKNNKFNNQLRQFLLTWSGHIKSWTEQDKIPFTVLRYEDMKDEPFREFSKAIKFAGLNFSDENIMYSIEQAKFENLKKKEEESGFREKNPKSPSFFREGKKSNWRGQLSDELVQSIIDKHKEILIKYNYLDENNNILI